VARDELRELVRDIIAAEDPRRPLPDDEVVAALSARGLVVARRTVAKYRSELGIPSSYRRRVFV
jgi:RNA polymerase sigma-54 factor